MEPLSLVDFLAGLARRKGLIVITAALVFAAAVLAALLWPPTYQSNATILMEEPAIPRDLVRSTIATYADQRVQVITKRVMATSNLLNIIKQHGLYAESREKDPVSVVVEKMRDDIKFRLVSADVVDPRSGRPTQANIAFTLSFDHRSPQQAQRVLSEIVSLYLAENVRSRQAKVSETAEFLSKEAAKLKRQIVELDAKRSLLKQKYAGSLPEDAQVNLQRIDRFQRSLRDTKSKIQVLEERKIFLTAELAQIDPQMSFNRQGGEESLLPRDKLRLLQSRFIGMNSRYGAAHPDIVRLKREIAALEQEVGTAGGADTLAEDLKVARDQLSALRKRYSAQHPDVKKLRRKVKGLEDALLAKKKKANQSEDKAEQPVQEAVNPAYIQLRAQLASIDFELNSLRSQGREMEKQVAVFEDRMAKAPEVERSYNALLTDYKNLTVEYRGIKTKLTEAELSKSLEAASKSERLSLIEPPLLPAKPISPNRIAILVLGFVFSLGSSIGLAGLLEATSGKIYGARQLAAITGTPPLAVIPEIVTTADRWRRRLLRGLLVAVVVGILAALTVAVHLYYLPLDVVWLAIQRRLDF